MKSEVVAERYAQALLEAAQKERRTETVLDQIDSFQKAASGLPLHRFWENPRISLETKETLIGRIFDGEADPLLSRFVRLLLRKGRISYLGDVLNAYQKLYDAARGVLRGRLTVAYPLESEIVDRLKSRLESQFNRTLELTYSENPKIIGGFIFSTGVTLIDASVQRQLIEMGARMRGASFI